MTTNGTKIPPTTTTTNRPPTKRAWVPFRYKDATLEWHVEIHAHSIGASTRYALWEVRREGDAGNFSWINKGEGGGEQARQYFQEQAADLHRAVCMRAWAPKDPLALPATTEGGAV